MFSSSGDPASGAIELDELAAVCVNASFGAAKAANVNSTMAQKRARSGRETFNPITVSICKQSRGRYVYASRAGCAAPVEEILTLSRMTEQPMRLQVLKSCEGWS
jgi:hypothetical protein